MKHMKSREHILSVILFILIGLSIFRTSILDGMNIITPVSYDLTSFSNIYLYSWQEQLGKAYTVQELLLALFLSPLLITFKTFGFSTFQAYLILEIFIVILSGITMYFLSYYLLKEYSEHKIIILCSFMSGLFYMTNPSFMIGDVQRYGTILGYAVFPLIIIYFMRALHENKKYLGVISAILTFYIFIFDFRYFVSSLIFFFLYFVYSQMTDIKNRNILKIYLVTLIVLLALFAPTIISWYSGRNVSTGVPLSKDAIEIPWRNAQLENILLGKSFMSVPDSYKDPSLKIINSYIVGYVIFLVPILSFLAILFYPRNRIVSFFTFVGLGFLIIFSFRDFLYWLTIDAPLHNFIGRMFRTTRIVDLFMSISSSVLIGFSILYIITSVKNRIKNDNNVKVLVLLIILVLFSSMIFRSWPLMTGDINGKFVSSKIPIEYSNINDWLSKQQGDYKVLWIPEFSLSYQPLWNNKNGADNMLVYSSIKSTYFTQDRINKPYFDFTTTLWYNSLLNKMDLNSTSSFLSDVGIKYIILHNDTAHLQEKVDKIVDKMKKDDNFVLVRENGSISVFENNIYSSDKVSIPKNTILISGGLETGKNLKNIVDSQYNDSGIIYIDQEREMINDLQNFDMIALTNYKIITDLIIPFIDKKYIIVPFDYSKEYEPDNKWSKGLLTDSHHAVWHNYLNGIKNQKWEFSNELNYGFIFTKGNDTLDIPLVVEKNGTYNILFRILKNYNGGTVNVYIDKKEIMSINTLDRNASEFVWYENTNISINKGGHIISLESIDGFNAINIGLFVSTDYYDTIKGIVIDKLVNKKIIYYIDSNELTYLFDDTDNATTKIKPIIGDNYSVYFVDNGRIYKYENIYLKDDTQYITFRGIYNNLAKNVSINDFNNIHNNFSPSIDCDNKFKSKCSYKVTSKTQNIEWSWIRKEIDVVPEKTYKIITYMKWNNTDQSHIAVDGYSENMHSYYRLANVPDGNVGVGTSDWKEFYTILKIPKDVNKLNISFNSGWVYDTYLDNATTWFSDFVIYDTDIIDGTIIANNEKENILEQAPAVILDYNKISPVLYKIRVNASKQFMLSFKESYDPLWVANVNSINGKSMKNKDIYSVPLYSSINGFWISQTGYLDIDIEYKPQKLFETSLAISMIMLISCVGYIFYDRNR